MTDAELRDAALVELKKTTRGLKGYTPSATSAWGKALSLLGQVAVFTVERDQCVAELRLTTSGYNYYTQKAIEPPPSSHWGKALTYLEAIMPTRTITLSASGGTTNLTGVQTVTALPSAAGQVINVKFYVDSILQGSADTTQPFSFSWNTANVSVGNHELKAVGTWPKNQVAEKKITVSVAYQGAPPPPPPPPPPPDPPVNVTVPSITGTATEGQTLSISEVASEWTNNPTSYTHQWVVCDAAGNNCTPILSATGRTYTLSADEVGDTVKCWTTAFNTAGGSVPKLSAQTAVVAALAAGVPVNVSVPVIAGTATVGNMLSINNGSWTNSPTSYTRQWLRCDSTGENCSSPPGETNSTYTLTLDDVGSTIRCWTTATNATGDSIAIRSGQTAVVPAASPPAGVGVSRATMLATGGTVLRNDTSAQADPRPGLWGEIAAVSAARHTHVTTGGDTRNRADNVAQGNTAFRRLTVQDGDDFYGERAALGRNEWQNGENTGSRIDGTFALANEGDHKITFWSMRFPAGFPTSTFAWQQILEWKQTQPYAQQTDLNRSGPPGVALELQLYGNALRVSSMWVERWTTIVPPLGQWIRFAWDVKFSQYPNIGFMKFYVDVDNDGNFNDANEFFEWHGATLCYSSIAQNGMAAGDSIPNFLEIGPYRNASYTGNSVVEIDNIQIVG